jgi:hypothetical protein
MSRTAVTCALTFMLLACSREPDAVEPAIATKVGNATPTEMPRAGLVYQLPAGWQRTPPSSSMRLDQAKVPGTAGEGDLAVFFFGPGGGGGVEDNLQRWASQVEGGEPERASFEANGLKISIIDVGGTLKPSSMGMGPTTDQPNSRLIAAVVEGPGGPWFFKFTGPRDTVSAEREKFVGMLRGARAGQQ